jgi:hypothetical protein
MTDDDVFQEGYDLASYETARGDLSDCPYFNGMGICSYGCHDEPQCQTCRPRGGWPTEQHPIVVKLQADLAAANADAEALACGLAAHCQLCRTAAVALDAHSARIHGGAKP